MTKSARATAWLLAALGVVLLVWDLYVGWVPSTGPGDTISEVVLAAVYDFPVLGMMAGVVVGHTMWGRPEDRTDETADGDPTAGSSFTWRFWLLLGLVSTFGVVDLFWPVWPLHQLPILAVALGVLGGRYMWTQRYVGRG